LIILISRIYIYKHNRFLPWFVSSQTIWGVAGGEEGEGEVEGGGIVSLFQSTDFK
jgi:hypothetical protein